MSKYRHAKGLSPMQILIIVGIAIVSLALIGGGAFAVVHFTSDKEEPTTAPTVATTAPTVAPATIDEPATEAVDEDAQYTELAKKHLATMSLEEKIYQMFMVTPESLTGVDVATAAGDQTKDAITKYPVGGIYYTSQNFEDATQTSDMIKNSQSYSKTPMFIAVSEEGGETAPVYSKLNTTKVDLTFTNSDSKKAFNSAATIAKDINKFGFNFNFSPFANVTQDAKPETVGENVVQAMKGYQSNSVVPAINFFPVASDSDKTLDEMKSSDFVPFVSAIKDSADVITLSASRAKGVDDIPAFMSTKIVTDILTNELKFSGVIITPNLSDTALTDAYDNVSLATSSVKAGSDILLCPNNIDEYFTAIKTAVDKGEIPSVRIDHSVTKILALKYKYGILSETQSQISNTQATQTATETETTAQ